MADQTTVTDRDHVVGVLADRVRSMQVTLLFIAVLLCVMLGTNLILITTD